MHPRLSCHSDTDWKAFSYLHLKLPVQLTISHGMVSSTGSVVCCDVTKALSFKLFGVMKSTGPVDCDVTLVIVQGIDE